MESSKGLKGSRLRPGPLLWATAGLVLATSLLMTASGGLVLLPLLVPTTAFIYLLLVNRVPGRPGSLIGVLVAVNFLTLSLVLYPPCTAPVLTRLRDGTFESSCAEEQNLLGLGVLTMVGSVLIGGLAWGLIRRRRMVGESSVEVTDGEADGRNEHG